MTEHKFVRARNLRFPWRDGNSLELLVDGEQFFPAMLSAIRRASSSVLFEMYLFESGTVANKFITALQQARARGVEVYLLLDGFGSLKLVESDRRKLIEADINLKFYNPLRVDKLIRNIARDHRKILVVDSEYAFVGGAGITDEFDPPLDPERKWRETMVRIRGPVVRDWVYMFAQAWGDPGAREVEELLGDYVGNVDGQSRARVTVGRGRLVRNLYQSLLKRVNRSEQSLWISTAYFVPSRRLRRALRRAATRKVDVRLLLPGPETDHPRVRIAGRRFYTRLLKSGVRIFEFQERVLHSKIVVCDQWVTIGSSNFDNWNLRWNLEANQEVEDPDFCNRTRAMLEHDFEHCEEISRDAWLQRPWPDRLGEWFWGWVEYWITRIGGKNWSD